MRPGTVVPEGLEAKVTARLREAGIPLLTLNVFWEQCTPWGKECQK